MLTIVQILTALLKAYKNYTYLQNKSQPKVSG